LRPGIKNYVSPSLKNIRKKDLSAGHLSTLYILKNYTVVQRKEKKKEGLNRGFTPRNVRSRFKEQNG